MEELRSTDILDKEIQSDARNKAGRILSKAEIDSKAMIDSVPERIKQTEKEKIMQYENKISAYEKDQEASFPLEKERFLVSFIQSAVDGSISDYLEKMSEEQRIEIVMRHMKKYGNIIKNKKMNAFIYGFDTDSVKKALEEQLGKNLLSCTRTEFNKLIIENDCGIKNKEGIILESDDKLVRCRLTLPEIVSQIKNKYRVELYNALFGGRLEK